MYAPFKKRATEYLGDGAPFLSVVTPDLYQVLLKSSAESGELFDRVVNIIGTPGSGKTTLAKLFQYVNARAIAQNSRDYASLYAALVDCHIVDPDAKLPQVIACRLPLESEYRNFWELPYQDSMRNDLLYMFIQARAILGWLRQFDSAGIGAGSLTIELSNDSPAQAETIGAGGIDDLRKRAGDVERVLYKAVASIGPVDLDGLQSDLGGPYAPFDVLRQFVVDGQALRPLIILDDFHLLQAEQRKAIYRQLTKRELRVSRWLLTRLDALSPSQAVARNDLLGSAGEEIPSDVSVPREVLQIRMQDDDVELRREFNKAARVMAEKYLEQHPMLRRRSRVQLAQALVASPVCIAPAAARDLASQNDKFARDNQISLQRFAELREMAVNGTSEAEPDVREAALMILMQRYIRRVPQTSLLADFDPEPLRPVSCDGDVVDGARIQLMHRFGRPLYGGLDTLINAASGNTEQFLLLCNPLVDALAAQLMRRRKDEQRLSLDVQHEILRNEAGKQIDSWVFPQNVAVRKLTNYLAKLCVKRTLEETAPLGIGPNAIGLEQGAFLTMLKEPKCGRLAQIIKYGVAYNALILRWNQKAKNKTWVVMHLHGTLCLYYGLGLKRGNFIDAITIPQLTVEVVD